MRYAFLLLTAGVAAGEEPFTLMFGGDGLDCERKEIRRILSSFRGPRDAEAWEIGIRAPGQPITGISLEGTDAERARCRPRTAAR